MKKLIICVLTLALCVLFVSCETNKTETSREVDPDLTKSNGVYENVDLDLTKLSSVMVYSEVYNMLYTPKNYVGKTVKMQGQFALGYSEITELYYPAVIIADATACCSQGMEFVLMGEPTYPDGYPEINAEVTVVGVFETYLENGQLYCHLINAEIIGD